MAEVRPFRTAALGALLLATVVPGASAQEWRTMSVSRQIAGESRLEVDLRHAAGTLRIHPVEGRTLYSMNLEYDAEVFDPVADYEGGKVSLGIEGRGRDIRIKKDGRSAEMDVGLTLEIPLALELDFGAGRADVDLGGLRLTRLDIETGASETEMRVSRPNPVVMEAAHIAVGAAQFTAVGIGNLNAHSLSVEAGVGEVVLDLSGDWRRDIDVEVKMGLGALELRVPRGLGVKLVKESFLTSLDAPEMDRDGDAWYSADWSSAERRITVDVDAAFGAVKVVWLR